MKLANILLVATLAFAAHGSSTQANIVVDAKFKHVTFKECRMMMECPATIIELSQIKLLDKIHEAERCEAFLPTLFSDFSNFVRSLPQTVSAEVEIPYSTTQRAWGGPLSVKVSLKCPVKIPETRTHRRRYHRGGQDKKPLMKIIKIELA